MDSLKVQEKDLEKQLETYRNQLTAISEQVEAGCGTELASLQLDLRELISLTEENLLEIKKQTILLSLELGSTESSITKDEHHCVDYSEDRKYVERLDNELEGMKCKAPTEESSYAVSYHNAMIMCKEPEEEDSKLKVRVLFTHPCFNSMKPCSYFLEGRCKFSETTCKYSHGHVVFFDQLKPFSEPDYSSIQLGSRCLAKRDDGLWYEATINSLSDRLTVKFISHGSYDAELSVEDVFPLLDSDQSDDHSDSYDDEDDNEERDRDEEEERLELVKIIDVKPSNPLHLLGDWEKHTTGIGSKLLAKMGYVTGQGLGKSGQGRLEPVPIEILPAGKSLDVCIALKEGKKIQVNDEQKRKKRRKRNVKKQMMGERSKEESTDIFQFLNTKLKRVDSVHQHSVIDHDLKGKSEESKKNLNVKLFQTQEELNVVQKKLKSLKQSFDRHRNRRDKVMEEHVLKKVTAAENQLQLLKRNEESLLHRIKRKTEQEKLSVF